MDEMQRVIRIVFLHYRKAFDLIDHNKLLENIKEMVVRSVLISQTAEYGRFRRDLGCGKAVKSRGRGAKMIWGRPRGGSCPKL